MIARRQISQGFSRSRRLRDRGSKWSLERALSALTRGTVHPSLELFAGSDALFLGRHGRAITTNAVRLVTRRARERAEITTRVHPHAFRSSFATHYVLNGGDPATAQAIMGIRSAQVFNGYVNVSIADMHAAHAKASPVERMLRGA